MVNNDDRVVHEFEVNTGGSACAESSVLRELARLKTGEGNWGGLCRTQPRRQ